MVGRSHFREEEKDCTLKTKRFPAIKYSSLQRKNFFFEQLLYFGLQSLMNFYFTNIFVHLQVIAAAFYFSIYKLIGWDPVNI